MAVVVVARMPPTPGGYEVPSSTHASSQFEPVQLHVARIAELWQVSSWAVVQSVPLNVSGTVPSAASDPPSVRYSARSTSGQQAVGTRSSGPSPDPEPPEPDPEPLWSGQHRHPANVWTATGYSGTVMDRLHPVMVIVFVSTVQAFRSTAVTTVNDTLSRSHPDPPPPSPDPPEPLWSGASVTP